MRVSAHPPGGLRPNRMPSRGIMITEGLAALIALVMLIAGLAAVFTYGAVLAVGLLVTH
jgi:hypothetical protein